MRHSLAPNRGVRGLAVSLLLAAGVTPLCAQDSAVVAPGDRVRVDVTAGTAELPAGRHTGAVMRVDRDTVWFQPDRQTSVAPILWSQLRAIDRSTGILERREAGGRGGGRGRWRRPGRGRSRFRATRRQLQQHARAQLLPHGAGAGHRDRRRGAGRAGGNALGGGTLEAGLPGPRRVARRARPGGSPRRRHLHPGPVAGVLARPPTPGANRSRTDHTSAAALRWPVAGGHRCDCMTSPRPGHSPPVRLARQ